MADAWHKAMASADLGPRGLVKVQIAGEWLLLARLEDGTVAASAAICPHQDADLSRGTIYMGAIDCPRHHYLYDLRTGRNRYPRDVFPADLASRLGPLTIFPVKEEEGWVWVRLEERYRVDANRAAD